MTSISDFGFPKERRSGILLHPTSLPSPAIGDLGPLARQLIDWLADAGQAYWQILPLVPVDGGGSPYNGLSAMAGNPLLLSPDDLVEDFLIDPAAATPPSRDGGTIDFPGVQKWKAELVRLAFQQLSNGRFAGLRREFEAFRARNAGWLDDYAIFRALRDAHEQTGWTSWPEPLRDRDPGAMKQTAQEMEREIAEHAFAQFLFQRQWDRLRTHAHSRGIGIIGDLPIFVAHDSADVWANREIFQLDDVGQPRVVAGVPPDYFSETGQRWGNPLYRWDEMQKRDFAWWVSRLRRTLEMVDLIRIDHFRGFESYWEVPAEEETAVIGRWVAGPGREFFDSVAAQLGSLPLIAEDLGIITREVEILRDDLGLPGMRVLQFSFDGKPENPHLPANHTPNSVAYTGTHDNDTVAGWWRTLPPHEQGVVVDTLGIGPHPTSRTFIEAVYGSAANLAIVPIQDVLGLGSEGRLNTPGVPAGNWNWQLSELPGREVADDLADLVRHSGRGKHGF